MELTESPAILTTCTLSSFLGVLRLSKSEEVVLCSGNISTGGSAGGVDGVHDPLSALELSGGCVMDKVIGLTGGCCRPVEDDSAADASSAEMSTSIITIPRWSSSRQT